MLLKAIAFDWGHTVINENLDEDVPLDVRPIHMMPGVSEVLPHLACPLALWANTRLARESDVRVWLERAGLGRLFGWVVTSVDAGARKPAPQFFEYALAHCGLAQEDVLFIGNQLNTDVAGGQAFGISTVWLSDPEYRSADDRPCQASPTYTIRTLYDLPTPLAATSVKPGFIGLRPQNHTGRGDRRLTGHGSEIPPGAPLGRATSVLASPKSRTFAIPDEVIMMFAGFKSRCTALVRRLDSCDDLQAEPQRVTHRKCPRASRTASVSPSTSSNTRNGAPDPSSSP